MSIEELFLLMVESCEVFWDMQSNVSKMRNKFTVKYMITTQPYTVLYPSQGGRVGKKRSCKYFQIEKEEEDGKQRK